MFEAKTADEAKFYEMAIADGIAPELAAKVAIFTAAIAPIVRKVNKVEAE